MVNAILPPVGCQEVRVKIPTLHFGLSPGRGFSCSRTERDGRKAGRTTEAFLSSTVDRVYIPLINPNRAACKGGDCIKTEQCSGLRG
jgi:hypothetical protein